ncbi:aromatase/cyclase [Streptomyces halobius]|uniref:Aromatase/cyclase n=1 Tax=Streptomyces halobius TaxID=2879846 RepID=A0ABY4MKL9_9ACTN|nr:aromatase/cyclase [Streptomyces halobius]
MAAPADQVYALIRDAVDWPQHFIPTLHVERAALGPDSERLWIWATANGDVTHWTSHRTLDPRRRRIVFEQEVCSPPVAAMSGEWTVDDGPDGGCELVLHHTFSAVDDLPENVDWITSATDRNSRTELANIRALAENAQADAELLFSFADSETVRGPSEQVYAFLQEAGAWPDRLPHVSRLDLREPSEGLQLMTMVTRAGNGSEHTTESVRVCFPHDRIVYKQLTTPPLMATHIGQWLLQETDDGVCVTSHHTIRVNEAAIPAVLGPEATPATARDYLREAVGGNSAATLSLAKRFAEAPHAV